MVRRRAPRPISEALRQARSRAEPATALAAVQSAWPQAVGERVAAVTRVVSESEGTVTVACESSVWAGELGLMSTTILESLTELMGDRAPARLRFEAAPAP